MPRIPLLNRAENDHDACFAIAETDSCTAFLDAIGRRQAKNKSTSCAPFADPRNLIIF
jgi:hypothetical protein